MIQETQNVFTPDECQSILGVRLEDSTAVGNNHLSDLLIYKDRAPEKWKTIFNLIEVKMSNVLNQYYDSLLNLLPKELITISHIGFLKDHDGSFTELHYDSEMVQVEKPYVQTIIKPFVALCYLTDFEEGGELFFPIQNVKFSPRRGSVIILPCNYTYPHLSTPVTLGAKHVCRVTYKMPLSCYQVEELEI